MRAVMAAAVLFFATTVHAGESSRAELSVFVTNVSYVYSSSNGSQLSGGAGLALSRVWTPQLATELSIAAERHRLFYTVHERHDGNAAVLIDFRVFNVFPVDLMAQYRYPNASRWTPFVAGGVRHISAPSDASLRDVPADFVTGDRTSAEIGAGALLRITPRVGLRFEFTRLLRSDEVNWDPLLRGSFGINWRF